VSTADGHRQETVGKVCLTVVFDRRTEEIYIRHTYILYILSQLKTRFVFRDRFLVQIRLVTEFTKCVWIRLTSYRAWLVWRRKNSVIKRAHEGLGKTNLISHSIDVCQAKPPKQRHYPVSPAMEKLIYAEIDRIIRLGVIKESDSSWSSSLVIVQKPGKLRLFLDRMSIHFQKLARYLADCRVRIWKQSRFERRLLAASLGGRFEGQDSFYGARTTALSF